MFISRVVIRNFRNFKTLDVRLQPGVSCIIGENNIGKTNLLHAIRLAIDVNLPSPFRHLTENDFHTGIDIRTPQQIIVSLEIRDYKDRDNERAMVGCWEVDDDLARVHYRFRPRRLVREEMESGERDKKSLTLEDYGWEWTGGGEADPAAVKWDEALGESIRISDLQYFQVVFLQALRDVTQDMRQIRISPLGKLLSASEIPEKEKNELVDTLREANKKISESPRIKQAGAAIDKAFEATAGKSYPMDISVGMADPSFSAIARALTLLLTDGSLADFDTARNGLGLNNILYVSMLVEYFEQRISNAKTAGQLLIVEEPEAHLHPQLQRTLYAALREKPFQTILSTHSTHITSLAPLESYVVLTNSGTPAVSACNPKEAAALGAPEVKDLERYLDATRSMLLYARKVILVEGPAELFVIPQLVKKVLGHDLDSLGITVVPIYGVHFQVYAKLFGKGAIEKKCAIIADGDLKPSDATEAEDAASATAIDLKGLENDFVKTFQCPTTFERAITQTGTLEALAKTADYFGIKKLAKQLRDVRSEIKKGKFSGEERRKMLDEPRANVLKAARRVGKARFAQVLSEHIGLAEAVPEYIQKAMDWLLAE